MPVRTQALTILLLAPLLLAASACAPSANPGTDGQREKIFDVLRHQSSAVSMVAYDSSLLDWLPNQGFAIDGQEPKTFGSGIVVGEITDIDDGHAYQEQGDQEGEARTEVAFDSPHASWRTLAVTVSTESAWGDFPGSTVRFGLSIDGSADVQAISASLLSQEKSVVALQREGSFDDDPTLHAVGRNGQLLGKVDSRGNISLPALEDSPELYLDGAETVHQLEAARHAERAPVIVERGQRLS